MIKPLLLTLALATPFAATAKEEPNCKLDALFAKVIMEARQGGVSMVKTLDIVPDRKEMVVAAYSEVRWSTERNQKKSVTDFQNDIYLECLTPTTK